MNRNQSHQLEILKKCCTIKRWSRLTIDRWKFYSWQNILRIWMSIAGRAIASKNPSFDFRVQCCLSYAMKSSWLVQIDRCTCSLLICFFFCFGSTKPNTLLPFNLRSSIYAITKSETFRFQHIRNTVIVKSSCFGYIPTIE